MHAISRYFPDLTSTQQRQFEALESLYQDWNQKVNVISRKDIQNLGTHHVLHSLAIAKHIAFNSQAHVLDVGTGGGFPGIPLAIMFPGTRFHLIDSIAKKVHVVREVAVSLGLKNVLAEQARAETLKPKYDFIVSRAVTNLPEFIGWIKNNISPTSRHPIKNGVLYLKGMDFEKELVDFKLPYQVTPLSTHFSEEFFATKVLVHIPMA